MEIEYWIITIGIILAFNVGFIENFQARRLNQDVNFFAKPTFVNDFNITIDCEYVNIILVYNNETIEICKYFKQNLTK